MRILGLDFGDKTIGVAVSDPFGWTAQGVEIIRRENPMEFKKCMRRLAELVEQYQAETIVLGYPKNPGRLRRGQMCQNKGFLRTREKKISQGRGSALGRKIQHHCGGAFSARGGAEP